MQIKKGILHLTDLTIATSLMRCGPNKPAIGKKVICKYQKKHILGTAVDYVKTTEWLYRYKWIIEFKHEGKLAVDKFNDYQLSVIVVEYGKVEYENWDKPQGNYRDYRYYTDDDFPKSGYPENESGIAWGHSSHAPLHIEDWEKGLEAIEKEIEVDIKIEYWNSDYTINHLKPADRYRFPLARLI